MAIVAGASEPVDTVAYADKDDYEEAEEGEDDDDHGVPQVDERREARRTRQVEIGRDVARSWTDQARAAVEVARELGFTRPHLDTPGRKSPGRICHSTTARRRRRRRCCLDILMS